MSDQLAHDERAEQSVLGAILHNPGVFADLAALKATHFYLPANEKVYASLLQMYNDGEEIDTITLYAKLRESQELRQVGGAPYLSDLLQSFKSAENISSYAQIVIDQWKLRQLAQLASRFTQLHNTAAADEVDSALDEARQFLDGVDDSQVQHSMGFRDLYEHWTEEQADERPVLDTPWLQLNDKLNGGMQRERLYVVGSRPGCGKTILLSQVAIYAALSHWRTLFFSLELSRADLMGRILACGSHTDYGQITRRDLSAESYGKVSRWAAACAELPLTVDDEPGLTIEEIAQRARIANQRGGIDLVCIDYLQLVAASKGGDSRVQQVDHIACRARAIARQLDCVVIVAAQLNRNIESHGAPRLPNKSDFRESGGIEQTADSAWILSRPPDDNGEEATQLPLMNLSVVKNRTGTEGVIQLAERFDQARFTDAV